MGSPGGLTNRLCFLCNYILIMVMRAGVILKQEIGAGGIGREGNVCLMSVQHISPLAEPANPSWAGILSSLPVEGGRWCWVAEV